MAASTRHTHTHTHSNTVSTVGCNILGIGNQEGEEELSFPRRGLSPQISVTKAPHQWAAAKRISIRWRDGKGVKEEVGVAEEHKKEEKGAERRGRQFIHHCGEEPPTMRCVCGRFPQSSPA